MSSSDDSSPGPLTPPLTPSTPTPIPTPTPPLASAPAAPFPRWEGDSKNFEAIATQEFSRMIYASNAVENTGLNLPDTDRLCQSVFTDEKVFDTYREEKRAALRRQRAEEEERWKREVKEQGQWRIVKWLFAVRGYFNSIIGVGGGAEDEGPGEVEPEVVDERAKSTRARREVIQHARAWKNGKKGKGPLEADWWVWSGSFRNFNSLGAGTLQRAHAYRDHNKRGERPKDGSKTPTPRTYRSTDEGRRPLGYIRASAVGAYMECMAADFEALRKIECEKGVDGYCNLAAWIEGMIINIWPFGGENSKLARLIGNAVLFRYCGIVVGIGDGEGEEGEEERGLYLDILRRASESFQREIGGLVLRNRDGMKGWLR
ncbi:hypothetical protein TWF481_012236 [Arthrobotrys musiformis]|uniref:Fido domain-containing protein n=1 Tax=Arthrobotrys musiformis TaxID=47236 RepID=A0AAV9VXI8_9PEZI